MIEVKATKVVIDVNERLVSNIFEINHKGLRLIKVKPGLR